MLVDLKPWTARADGPDIAEGIRRIRALRIGTPAIEAEPARYLPASSGQWTGR